MDPDQSLLLPYPITNVEVFDCQLAGLRTEFIRPSFSSANILMPYSFLRYKYVGKICCYMLMSNQNLVCLDGGLNFFMDFVIPCVDTTAFNNLLFFKCQGFFDIKVIPSFILLTASVDLVLKVVNVKLLAYFFYESTYIKLQ